MKTLVLSAQQQDWLLRAAFLEGDAAAAAWRAWNATIDWDSHLDVDAFRILPHLCQNLSHMAAEPLLAKFRGIARKAWYNNQLLFHAAAPLLARLADERVETRLVFGAPLALCYYPEYVLGMGSEFGIAVRAPQARAAIEVLAQAGWTAAPPLKRQTLTRYLAARDGHRFVNETGQSITLQWRIVPGSDDSPLWDEARSAALQGTTVSVLDPTAQLFITLVVGPRPEFAGFLARALDTMLLLRAAGNDIDWARLAARAREYEVDASVGGMLAWLKRALDAPVPERFAGLLGGKALPEDKLRAALDRRPTARGRAQNVWDYYARRTRHQNALARGLGLPRYLGARWQLEHSSAVARAVVEKVWRELRAK